MGWLSKIGSKLTKGLKAVAKQAVPIVASTFGATPPPQSPTVIYQRTPDAREIPATAGGPGPGGGAGGAGVQPASPGLRVNKMLLYGGLGVGALVVLMLIFKKR